MAGGNPEDCPVARFLFFFPYRARDKLADSTLECGLDCGLGVWLPRQPGRSAFHLVGYPNVRIRQMKANFFYIVQALVHVKVGLGIAPVQIESLERGPWSELRGQVPANIVSGKTEDAPDASKNMHLHLRSASLHSPDDRSDRV